MRQFLIIAITAMITACGATSSAQAVIMPCPGHPSQLCDVRPVAAPVRRGVMQAPYRATVRANIMIGAPAPVVYGGRVAVQEQYPVRSRFPALTKGPCPQGGVVDDDNAECVRTWTAGELGAVMKIHQDNDPNCGPGKSGTIYSSVEAGSDGITRTVRRRCR